ncbi:hypothetical protein [Candidatus Berkiella aquae]|uniref:Uncharacterized protein n=1 Tax=Candidatus Berkiella aquae TaxID=295108 RepID=A0A0Q9YM51_9GAMM|nr:hypothetical protein [Candidatus Berkiella aquae]MCS5710547.1 hypothetical protein [Candidatus Berkiella aquae]
MKQLNIMETNLVSGGDYDLNLTLHVPSSVAAPISGLIQAIVTGQVTNTTEFANQLTSAGPILDEVRITDISFSDFN